MKKILTFMLGIVLFLGDVNVVRAGENDPELTAQSAILMEAEGGQIIFQKNSDEQLPPASVTKVMTLLLIFDALAEGKIHPEDIVTVSEYAASMGGSQVFLEAGETQTVDTMVKCIAVSSANDACVAMAEFIAGSEAEFVRKMNERAKGLDMNRTNFVNCNGLDVDGHVTTAADIAKMSRELIVRYPKIEQYSTIWMETITHTTRKGTSEFGLSNTNKFIRQYEYATGLKTGSTSKAKFCLSATARKGDIELIAVVMACPDAKARVRDSIALMGYGFGKCTRYRDEEGLKKPVRVDVIGGESSQAEGVLEKVFTYIDISGAEMSEVKKKAVPQKSVKAPVKKGDVIGTVIYTLHEDVIGTVPILAKKGIPRMTYGKAVSKTVMRALGFQLL